MRQVVVVAVALLLVACTAGPAPSDRATEAPTPTIASFEPEPTATPTRRSYGPDFSPTAPNGTVVPIMGAVLSHDRRTLTIDFLGTQPYTRHDWCAQDYEAWAGIAGEELDIQVDTIKHPDQATAPPNGACTVDGFGYIFELHLPGPFTGSVIRDRASGVLWVPPPERLAELGSIPPGWVLSRISGSKMSDPGPHQLDREYGPGPTIPGPRDRYYALIQVFGGPPNDPGESPVATATVHGVPVPVVRNGDAGFAVSWDVGADSVTLSAYDASLTLDAFVAMANAVEIPGS